MYVEIKNGANEEKNIADKKTSNRNAGEGYCVRTLKYHRPSHIAFRETVTPRTSAVWLGRFDRVYSWVKLCLSVRYAVKLA